MSVPLRKPPLDRGDRPARGVRILPASLALRRRLGMQLGPCAPVPGGGGEAANRWMNDPARRRVRPPAGRRRGGTGPARRARPGSPAAAPRRAGPTRSPPLAGGTGTRSSRRPAIHPRPGGPEGEGVVSCRSAAFERHRLLSKSQAAQARHSRQNSSLFLWTRSVLKSRLVQCGEQPNGAWSFAMRGARRGQLQNSPRQRDRSGARQGRFTRCRFGRLIQETLELSATPGQDGCRFLPPAHLCTVEDNGATSSGARRLPEAASISG